MNNRTSPQCACTGIDILASCSSWSPEGWSSQTCHTVDRSESQCGKTTAILNKYHYNDKWYLQLWRSVTTSPNHVSTDCLDNYTTKQGSTQDFRSGSPYIYSCGHVHCGLVPNSGNDIFTSTLYYVLAIWYNVL